MSQVSPGQRVVVLAAIACALAGGGCDDAEPVSVVKPLHIITVPIPAEAGTTPPELNLSYSGGIALRASADGPNRFLFRGGAMSPVGPFWAASKRANSTRQDAAHGGRDFDIKRPWPVVRDDETDEFRQGWVIDIDIATGVASLSSNEAWDRAAGPTEFTGGPLTGATEIGTEAERLGSPRSVKLADGRTVMGMKFASGRVVPAFGGGLVRSLGRSGDGRIVAQGSFGFPFGERDDELRNVSKAIAGGDSRGNGNLFVQFFDTTTEQRVGPVFEAHAVLPFEATVHWGYIWTPDGRHLLIIGSRWDVQPNRMSVVISVIPIPEPEKTEPSARP